MQVEVVYATADKQTILELNVPDNTTIEQAIIISGILELYPELVGAGPRAGPDQPSNLPVGIFGKPRSLDWALKDGDRVEIYRPLVIDPKDARVKRAKLQQKAKRIAVQRKNEAKRAKGKN